MDTTTKQPAVVVIAQDPEFNTSSPDDQLHFKSHKKAIMGMSIAMIVFGALSFFLQVNFQSQVKLPENMAV